MNDSNISATSSGIILKAFYPYHDPSYRVRPLALQRFWQRKVFYTWNPSGGDSRDENRIFYKHCVYFITMLKSLPISTSYDKVVQPTAFSK